MKVDSLFVQNVESKKTRTMKWLGFLPLFLVIGCATLPTPPYRQAAVPDITAKPEVVTVVENQTEIKKKAAHRNGVVIVPAQEPVKIPEEPMLTDSPSVNKSERAMNANAMTVSIGFLSILLLFGMVTGAALHKIGKSYPTVEEVDPETGKAETLVIVDDEIKSQ